MRRSYASPPSAPTPDARVAAGVFVAFAGLTVLYALRGGTYDLVVRHEAGLGIWVVLGLGLATGLLPRARLPRQGVVVLVALALLAAWTTASMAWTESPERTFAETGRLLHHLGLAALVLCVLGPRTWRAALGGLATGAVAVCALALASRLAPGAFPADGAARAFATRRLSYPFGYWNAVGAWGAMTVALALGASVHARSLALRAAALAAIPVASGAVYLTYSRAGAVAVPVGVVVVIAAGPRRWLAVAHGIVAALGSAAVIAAIRGAHGVARGGSSAGAGRVVLAVALAAAALAAAVALLARTRLGERRTSPRAARAAAAIVAALLVAGAVTAVASGVTERAWKSFRTPTDVQAADPAARLASLGGTRYEHWRTALREFRHAPLGGTGAGTFELWETRAGDPEFARDAHSFELEQLGELGLPGGLLALAVVATLFLAAWAGLRVGGPGAAGAVGVVAAYAVSSGVDWMWELTADSALALACATAAAAAAGGPRPVASRRTRAAAAALAVVARAALASPLLATSDGRAGRAALRAGRYADAERHARDALRVEPWAVTPRLTLALVDEQRGRLAAARRWAREAATREPTNWRPRLLLARIDLEDGRVRQAVAEWRAAKARWPQISSLPGVGG
ncbi:MAG: O-antigen ligase family protein [Solirubrobacteraceae bacterium]